MDADLIFMCPLNLITVIITEKKNWLICKTSWAKSQIEKSFWDDTNLQKQNSMGNVKFKIPPLIRMVVSKIPLSRKE